MRGRPTETDALRDLATTESSEAAGPDRVTTGACAPALSPMFQNAAQALGSAVLQRRIARRLQRKPTQTESSSEGQGTSEGTGKPPDGQATGTGRTDETSRQHGSAPSTAAQTLQEIKRLREAFVTQLRDNVPKLVSGGDQSKLETKSREHYASTTGRKGADQVPKNEVSMGSVAENQQGASQFASQLPAHSQPESASHQYNLWSGMGPSGGRAKAESQGGFVMQQTPEFAEAIWHVRNVSGFVNSAEDWPWDPGYHMAMARWLETRQAEIMVEQNLPKNKAWPSEKEIAAKLEELKKSHVANPKEKVRNEGDKGEYELIGFNRKIGDSIFEPASEDLARRAALAMIPVMGFGLSTHSTPETTVQSQVEIPVYVRTATQVCSQIWELIDLVKQLVGLLPESDQDRRSRLTTIRGSMVLASGNNRRGAQELLKPEKERSQEHATWVREARDQLLKSFEQLDEVTGGLSHS